MNLQFSPIKFYRGRAFLLDEISTKLLIHRLNEKYSLNTEIDFKTPGFKYYKALKEDDLTFLKSYRHLVTPYYGINPVWILWLTRINEQNYNFYINFVTNQIIWSPHRFAEELYRWNVIFEGEIYDNTFLVWDLLSKKGQPIYKFNSLYQRLDRLRGIFNYQYQPDSLIENLDIKLRSYVEYPYIKSFVQSPDCPPDHKGLLFIPIKNSTRCFSLQYDRHNLKTSLVPLTGKELEKLNPQEIQEQKMKFQGDNKAEEGDQLREFWVQPVSGEIDNYLLYNWTDNLIYKHDRALVGSLDNSSYLKQIFKDNKEQYRSKSGAYPLLKFKCRWVPRFRKWEAIEFCSLDQD